MQETAIVGLSVRNRRKGTTYHQGLTVFSHFLRTKSATRGTDGEGEPMPERRDEVMPEPGGYFELGGCLTSFVYDHDASWQ